MGNRRVVSEGVEDGKRGESLKILEENDAELIRAAKGLQAAARVQLRFTTATCINRCFCVCGVWRAGQHWALLFQGQGSGRRGCHQGGVLSCGCDRRTVIPGNQGQWLQLHGEREVGEAERPVNGKKNEELRSREIEEPLIGIIVELEGQEIVIRAGV